MGAMGTLFQITILLLTGLLAYASSLAKGESTKATLQASLHRRYHLFDDLIVQRSKARSRAMAIAAGIISNNSKAFQSPVDFAPGAYNMQIRLGTPPRIFSAIMDTGSDLVWVQCRPCLLCFSQTNPVFDPSSSSSYVNQSCTSSACQELPLSACSRNTCLYDYRYGDSSRTRGNLATETITMVNTNGSTAAFEKFIFGCGHLNSGTFSDTDGLVGLGQGPLSLTSQLAPQIGAVFSYCLVDSKGTSPLLFGSSAMVAGATYKSTPIIPNSTFPTYYFVGLEGISVGGQPLNLPTRVISFTRAGHQATAREVNSGGTIFDSGTTLTLLDDSVYSVVRSAFASMTRLTRTSSVSGFDLCYDVSGMSSVRVPALTLSFTGADLNPAADNYFVLLSRRTGRVMCLAMSGTGVSGIGIIGNIMQQNYHVIHDLNAKQISFAPTSCDTIKLT